MKKAAAARVKLATAKHWRSMWWCVARLVMVSVIVLVVGVVW